MKRKKGGRVKGWMDGVLVRRGCKAYPCRLLWRRVAITAGFIHCTPLTSSLGRSFTSSPSPNITQQPLPSSLRSSIASTIPHQLRNLHHRHPHYTTELPFLLTPLSPTIPHSTLPTSLSPLSARWRHYTSPTTLTVGGWRKSRERKKDGNSGVEL